ncbi:hypothetical protein CXB51_014229 [Gossypium anomalum]|uniref:Aminotransferase-like plant mobile domain-containing protein n=1 Tax=Gossypium anomalum TaxID=47600 RepID=A0A8J6D4N9_9ROSI|nr:hypothetical protein CXB51_014229 [Gossypium anomalum]
MALIDRGVNWTPTLVSALVEMWKPKKHTFHLPCDKCTITLEDVQLQRELLSVAVVSISTNDSVDTQDFEDLYHIDLRGRTDKHWPSFHAEYINIWNNRYEFLPAREAIIALELASGPEYREWFRAHGKPYLLVENVTSQNKA